jgi:methyl-accepting chemotaxis protein
MTDEQTVTAAILGELIPSLEYAAPVLVERHERGEPLIGISPATDLGFDGSSPVDFVLLEFFKALVPHVKTVLACGVLGAIQTWQLSRRIARNHLELVATINTLAASNPSLCRAIQAVADLQTRFEGAAVPLNEIIEAIGAAADRLNSSEDPRRRK